MEKEDWKKIREELGLTKAGLAKKMGIHRSKATEYENGERPIPKYHAKHLEGLLELKRLTRHPSGRRG